MERRRSAQRTLAVLASAALTSAGAAQARGLEWIGNLDPNLAMWVGAPSDPNDAEWSIGSNWLANHPPANNGTANVLFQGSTASLVSIIDAPWSIASITFASNAQGYLVPDPTGPTRQTLTVGAGGLTDSSSVSSEEIFCNIALGTSQTWTSNAVGELKLGPTISLGSNTLTYDGTGTFVTSGMNGSGGVTKNGTGLLILNSNTYSGPTIVNSGALSTDYPPSGATAISGSSLVIGNGTSTAAVYEHESNAIGNSTVVTINNMGSLNLDRFESISDPTTQSLISTTFNGGSIVTDPSPPGPCWISLGTVTVNASSTTASISGSLNQNGNFSWSITAGTTASGIDLDVPAEIFGGGSLTKLGAGTLRLSGANTSWTGGLTVNAGTVLLGDNAAAGTGTLTLVSGGTIQADGAARTLANTVTLSGLPAISGSLDLTLTGAIGGTGGINKIGSSTLYLTHANSYSGGTIVNAGILAADYGSNDGQTCIGHSLLTINTGGTVRIDDNNAMGFSGNEPPIVINAGGTMTIVTFASQHLLSLTLNGGTLAGAAPGGSGVIFGTYNFDNNLTAGGSTTTSTLSAPNVALTTTGGTTFTVNPGATNGIDLDVTGTIGAPGGVTNTALIKAGAGVMRFTNVNTFTAGLTINAGTVTIASGGSIASGVVTVASGATLNVNGSLAGTATVTDNGTTTFAGNSSTSATFTRSLAALGIGNTALAKVGLSASALFPEILNSTSLTFSGTGKLDLTNNELTTTATPASIRARLASGAIFTSHAGGGTTLGYTDLGGGVTEVRYTLSGDTNLDTKVNVTDLGNLATNFGATAGATWVQGDFDYNGTVNVADLGDLASDFGTSLAAGSVDLGSQAASPTVSVPEPVSMVSVVSLVALVSRRRRRFPSENIL